MPLSAGLAHGRPPHPRRAGWGRGARLTPPSSWSPPGAPQGLSPSSRVSLENRGHPLEPGAQWGFGPPSRGRARASGRSARTHGERGWGRLSEPLSVPGPRHRPEQQLPWSPGGRQVQGRYRCGVGRGWGGSQGPEGSRLGRPTGEGPVQRNAGGLLLFPRKDRASWQLGAPQEPQAHGLSGSRACPASCVQLGPRPEETQHPPAVAGQGRGGGPRPAPRHCTWASTPPNPTALHWPGPLRQG